MFRTRSLSSNIKQLLDEVEHDIMNYQNRGLCYLPKPKAEADNTDIYHVKFTSYCELIECSRPIRFFIVSVMYNNKQLLDEVEHDIMNYQNRGLCYLPKPKAEADNTDTRF